MSSRGNKVLAALGRRMLIEAQGGICPHCGGKLDFKINWGRETPNVEHIWPLRKGKRHGRNRIGNVLISHQACNSNKGADDPTGCELLILFAANRRIGLSETFTAKFDSPWGNDGTE